MRGFLIAFSHSNGTGNLFFASSEFPSNKWLREEAINKFKCKDPVVINIFEFKSMEDFNKFAEQE